MTQLAEIEQVVAVYTNSDAEAGALFFELLEALRWNVEGVSNARDATEYLNRE